jgi:hypothetical protein
MCNNVSASCLQRISPPYRRHSQWRGRQRQVFCSLTASCTTRQSFVITSAAPQLASQISGYYPSNDHHVYDMALIIRFRLVFRVRLPPLCFGLIVSPWELRWNSNYLAQACSIPVSELISVRFRVSIGRWMSSGRLISTTTHLSNEFPLATVRGGQPFCRTPNSLKPSHAAMLNLDPISERFKLHRPLIKTLVCELFGLSVWALPLNLLYTPFCLRAACIWLFSCCCWDNFCFQAFHVIEHFGLQRFFGSA